jgi:hypothetical protein
MTGRVRLLILLARPAVGVLLGLCAATGLAQGGQGENRLLLARVLVAVMGFLVFSVAVNDLADEAIDRVNLAGDRRRPLVAGTARGELVVIGATAGVVALGASATLHWAAAVVLAAGLALSAAYSLRPLRVADRGGGRLPAAAGRLRGRPLPGGRAERARLGPRRRPVAAGCALHRVHRSHHAQGLPGRPGGCAVRQAHLPGPPWAAPDLWVQRGLLGGGVGRTGCRGQGADLGPGGRLDRAARARAVAAARAVVRAWAAPRRGRDLGDRDRRPGDARHAARAPDPGRRGLAGVRLPRRADRTGRQHPRPGVDDGSAVRSRRAPRLLCVYDGDGSALGGSR